MASYYSNIKEQRLVRVNERIIGRLEDNKFIKSVIGSRHKLRRPEAWCLSAAAFNRDIQPFVDTIVIHDKESGITYQATVAVFIEHSFPIQRGNFEKQLALTLNHWEVKRNGHEQLGLWGGGE